jgi:angiomotin like
MDHSQSNRSSLDVSQSSYSTLIIHDNNESQPLFAAPNATPGLIKHDLYFINSSPSPPNYNKKEKSTSRSLANYVGHMHGSAEGGGGMTPITENEQQYLNQSYVLKHLAKEVKIPSAIDSTRDSGVSENTSSPNHQHWPESQGGGSGRSKSKSQPDLTKLSGDAESHESNNSATNTLNFNDFEQLEAENNKLREQLNDCLMKVAKSQQLKAEVSNIYRVHEELVQSCERRERLERTARTRLQSDCRRLQELNRALREQVETLQQQLLIATTQQQQQLASTGRTQQDLLITQLIQQNKELVDANKRQYIEIQAQSATLEEQRIHINVLDSALKRLEEEVSHN